MSRPIKELAKGFKDRTWVTAKLAAKVGMSAARRQIAGAKTDAPSDAQVHESIEAAKKLVVELGQLKGLVMKVGQMASYLPGALPAPAQEVLAELQAQSTRMDTDQVRAVLEAELGASVDELFESFDPEPIAAASIGQVHRARHRGRDVAVKIQYPGIEEVLKSDLSTFSVLTKVGTFGLPIDAAALAEELRSRILEECDYRIEAASQRALAPLLEKVPGASVPEVIEERSSQRVLTTELVDAMPFGEFARTASQAAKDRAGEIIFRTCMETLFKHGVYNGDPHPGNYLFRPDGSVVFLDFGCVRRFEEDFIEKWKAFARSMIDGDRAVFPERYRALGMVGTERGYDWDGQYEVVSYLYRPLTQREPFMRFDDDYVRGSYAVLLFDNPNQRKTACPPEWLLLNRLQWGMYAVLAKLDARAAWPDFMRGAALAPFEGPVPPGKRPREVRAEA
ncbi:MAG: ABC1 kinase family protein [Sandaracinaceae bacterium]